MMNRQIFNKVLIPGFFICVFIEASAQDTHYWNLQYGSRSTLLGGAVIGSVTDLAATYYNPAALALYPEPEILLSGKVFQYSILNLENGAGPGKDLTSSTIEPAPTLFAGSFTFDWLGDNTLSYSILTRQRMNYDIEGRRGGIRGTGPDEDLVAGELIANQELSDLWIGLSWAVKLTPDIAFGITPYVSVRNQKTRKHIYSEILDPAGNVSTAIITQQFEYINYRILAKAGIGANFDPLTLGFTITTPSLSVSGDGSSWFNLVNSGDVSDEQTIYMVNYQQDVTARHKIPLALGMGAGYRLGKHRLHFSGEWYNKIAAYNVLDISDFRTQSSNELITYRVDTESKSVFNYGLGAEFYLEENLNLYVSYVTDFSASVPDTRTNLTVSTWDIYHLSTGASFSIGRSEFTLGINYSFGSDKVKGPVKLPEGNVKNTLADLLQNSELTYTRLKFLIGFSFQI